MQRDTRNLTVAREHLNNAHEEITRAQGQTERSMAEQGVRRALDHLNLVTQRLETERSHLGGTNLAPDIESAFVAARHAWQGTHNLLNDWAATGGPVLEQVRRHLRESLDALERACGGMSADAVHP